MRPLTLTRNQVREVDRLAVEQYGMSSLVLMENAGRSAVDKLLELGLSGTVVICCGKGNNGGDGFVMARHLSLRQVDVKLLLWCDPAGLRDDAAANYHICQRTGLPIEIYGSDSDTTEIAQQLATADVVVDALLGTGSQGQVRPPLDEAIRMMNASPAVKVAIDIPSGLDCDTGKAAEVTFQADRTLTFIAPKPGFFRMEAKPYVGEVHVMDIGAPRELIDSVRTLPARNASE